MKKNNSKQIIAAAFFTAVVGLSSAPLSVGAVDNDYDRNNNSWNRDNDHRDISEWQARRIAQHVFPNKRIVRVELRRDDNRREYQVRFADGSRVDVRVRDGQVTYVDNNSRRGSYNNWH